MSFPIKHSRLTDLLERRCDVKKIAEFIVKVDEDKYVRNSHFFKENYSMGSFTMNYRF